MRILSALAALAAVLALVLTTSAAPAAENPGTPITTQAELQALMSESVPIVVDFHADWCGPCQIQKPILSEVLAAHPSGVIVVTVDVDVARELAAAYQIESIPTLIQFRNGAEHDRKVGVTQRPELKPGWACSPIPCSRAGFQRTHALSLELTGHADGPAAHVGPGPDSGKRATASSHGLLCDTSLAGYLPGLCRRVGHAGATI